MSLKDEIKQLAIQVANEVQERALRLKPELREMEQRKAQIEAELHAADLCRQRLSDFQPEIGGNLQCPRCWVARGVRSQFVPMPGTKHVAVFTCRDCHFDLTFPST